MKMDLELFSAIGNHFFHHFSETPARKNFYRLVEKYFSGQWKPFCFVQSCFLSMETVTEISGSQFLKKDHILTSENQFYA